jgi:hypothetical protein
MPKARDVAWTNLFNIFQEIHPRKPPSEKDWDTLWFLIEALDDEKHREDWAEIAGMLEGVRDTRRVSMPLEWRKLYDALDKLWADERMDDATQQELAAHAGAFTRFRLFS